MTRSWSAMPLVALAAGALLAACSPSVPDGSRYIPVTTVAEATTSAESTTTTTTVPEATTTTLPPPIEAGAEVDIEGWSAGKTSGGATLERDATKAHSGQASFRLIAGQAGGALLNDSPNLITAAAGTRCTASAWVSGPVGTDVRLSLREFDGDVRVGAADANLELTDTDWHRIDVGLTVVAGRAIDVNVRSQRLAPGNSLSVDDITEACVDPPAPPATTATPVVGDPIVVAAGSIACAGGATSKRCGQSATAKVVGASAPTRVLPLGDLQLGAATNGLETAAGYGPFGDRPSWGDFAKITSPTLGRHEFADSDTAAGYFEYWNATTSEPGVYGTVGDGWYAEDIGTWRVVHLNTERAYQPGGAQDTWLRQTLASAGDRCVAIAASRQPFSADASGQNRAVALFGTAFAGGADVWLAADARRYERFAAQNPSGVADETHGVSIFVIGTGGAGLDDAPGPADNRVAADSGHFGVLRMKLREGAYDWEFVTVDGAPVDSGTGTCHGAPPPSDIAASSSVPGSDLVPPTDEQSTTVAVSSSAPAP